MQARVERTIGEAEGYQEQREGRHPQARVQCSKGNGEEHEGRDNLENLGGEGGTAFSRQACNPETGIRSSREGPPSRTG